MKYVITKDNEPMLFSKNIIHSKVTVNIIRAGFVGMLINEKLSKFEIACFGESSSLNLKSDAILDKIIIEKFLNL